MLDKRQASTARIVPDLTASRNALDAQDAPMVTDDSRSPPLPAELAAFRDQYRSSVIGRHYNGFAHLAFVVVGSLVVIGVALSFVRAPTWLDWLCIPVTF